MKRNGMKRKGSDGKNPLDWWLLPKCSMCGKVRGKDGVGVVCLECFEERVNAPNT